MGLLFSIWVSKYVSIHCSLEWRMAFTNYEELKNSWELCFFPNHLDVTGCFSFLCGALFFIPVVPIPAQRSISTSRIRLYLLPLTCPSSSPPSAMTKVSFRNTVSFMSFCWKSKLLVMVIIILIMY